MRATYLFMLIGPLIYTPLTNSRWLHNAALTYVRTLYFGTCMRRNGLQLVKKGLKWAIVKVVRTLEGPIKAQIGLKLGSCHLFVHPHSPMITFGKAHF